MVLHRLYRRRHRASTFRCHLRPRLRGCSSPRLHLPPLGRVVECGIDALEGCFEIPAKFGELLRQSSLPRYEHIVAASPRMGRSNAAQCLPQTSPDPVADNRIADFFRHREAEAGPADIDSVLCLGRAGLATLFIRSLGCSIIWTGRDAQSWPRFHEKAGSAEAGTAPDTQEFGTFLEGKETSCSRSRQARSVLRPTVSCGPWPGDVRARERRRSLPYAYGSHGGVCGQAGSVGMYVSRHVSENLRAARQG